MKPGRHRVLVADGGVAAVEALLALRRLAGRRVELTLLSPEPEFAPRAASVAAPFGFGAPRAIPLAALEREFAAVLRRGALTAVDHLGRVALVDENGAIPYDTLVVAVGARARGAVPGALTFTGGAAAPELERMLDAAQRGALRELVIAVPEGSGWTLPAYELAIMAAVDLRDRGAKDARVTLVTPEHAPLALFGASAGSAIAEMLEQRDVTLVRGAPVEWRDGRLLLRDAEPVAADGAVSLPVFDGPRIAGLPADERGFLRVDGHGRVEGVADVYAAGDATAFPVKQGGLATQQADAVAEAIAAGLGALSEPTPFRPVLRGLLLTGGAPLYLRAELTAEGEPLRAVAHPSESAGDVSGRALWWPPGKVAGRYLAPFLATARRVAPADEQMVDRVARAASQGREARATAPDREARTAGPDPEARAAAPDREAAASAAAADREEALTLALALAEQDARMGDYRQAVHALDAAAALSGGVLPSEYATRRDAWARIGADH